MSPKMIAVVPASVVLFTAGASADTWTDYDDIGPTFEQYEALYPDICERHDLGLSVQGRHIWALRITDNIAIEEDEPEFKYISTMHGDEIVGTKLLMMLAEDILTGYGSDPRLTNLVDEIDIWLVPLMNPDGYDRANRTRGNANGVNLNRDFPAFGEPDSPVGREPETGVIMDWMAQHSFTLSANMHTGALVVNYPFDNDDTGTIYSPDDDLFIYISEEYSWYNQPMWNSPYFTNGITNGSEWYMIWGGMQDWNYLFRGCNEVTLELSNVKEPPASQIPQFWLENRESMLAYMETCLLGVRGLVTDASTGDPIAATVRVVDRDHDIFTDPDVGDYHRMLLPGTYDLSFSAPGFDTLTVTDVNVTAGGATFLDVALNPPPQLVFPDGGEILPAGVETAVTWDGLPDLRYHVQYTSNYGESAGLLDGFESGVLDPAYDTGGNAPWFVTSQQSHEGDYAAEGGDISHNQTTWLERTVSGGDISFWYRVSSEDGWDYFNFYIDGERVLHVSGVTSWIHFEDTLADGDHLLRWEYDKDGSVSEGADTAWIDDLLIVTDTTEWNDIVALTEPGAESAAWTPDEPSEFCKVRVRAAYDGGASFGVFDESEAVFTIEDGSPCPADLNDDGFVDVSDLLQLLAAWGESGGDADINGDGTVDVGDLLELLAAWGAC